MKLITFPKVVFLFLLLMIVTIACHAQSAIFWGDQGKLGAVEKNGSNLRDLLKNDISPWAIDVNLSTNIVYIADRDNKQIRSVNTGTSVNTVIHNLTNEPIDVAVDAAGGKIYWIEGSVDQIKRSNLDGSSIEIIINTGITDANAISLDGLNNKIYWTDQGSDQISRANLDGTTVEIVLPSVTDPQDVAVDGSGGVIYWAEGGTANRIRKSNLSGGGIANLLTLGGFLPTGLSLNIGNNEIYWTRAGRVQRSDLTIPSAVDVVTGLGTPNRVVADMAGNRLYYVDVQKKGVTYAELDGSSPVSVIAPIVGAVKSLEYDGNDFVYYNDEGLQQIRRYQISNGQVTDITVAGLGDISGLALNLQTNELYWANNSLSQIQKSSISGGGVSNVGLFTPSPMPVELEVDAANNHIYWAAPANIYRINTNGTGITAIITGLSSQIFGFDIDLTNGKMYWSDPTNNRIEIANLDGTIRENFITGLTNNLGAILVDPSNSHLYWVNGLSITNRTLREATKITFPS